MTATVKIADVHEIPLPDDSVDLVFTSPPYEDARTYGIDFDLAGETWVEWAVAGYLECLRVCRGLVAWVVDGRTKGYRYSCAPELLVAELHRRGVHLRRPPVYRRSGIPGSGGPDWFRCDHEPVVCATSGGRLPWSDPTACGHPPKYAPGGPMSNRRADGTRSNGNRAMPKLANPGSVIDCGAVGGGNIGSKLAHQGQAPFPEKLVERFVRSFCPPGGTVLDPMCGSGTTPTVALKWGRLAIAFDIRQSQVDLTRQRLEESSPSLFAGSA